jgi:hypothetical protein
LSYKNRFITFQDHSTTMDYFGVTEYCEGLKEDQDLVEYSKNIQENIRVYEEEMDTYYSKHEGKFYCHPEEVEGETVYPIYYYCQDCDTVYDTLSSDPIYLKHPVAKYHKVYY